MYSIETSHQNRQKIVKWKITEKRVGKPGLNELFILGPRCLTTNDSPDKNADCKFPWKFQEKILNECTTETDPDGK